MELVLFLAVVLLVGTFVTTPLRRPAGSGVLDARTAALEAARDAKLREIHDADLDRRTGKLSDSDYAALDMTLRAEAAELLRELDEARAGASA
jgi:hypothetical protein